jgi:outer membrane receptor for ferrienterochelin and colicins
MTWRCTIALSAFELATTGLLLACHLAAQDPLTSAGADNASPESVLFESTPVVEAATLHKQTLQEAPASITVITAEEIRKYGFRTLGEALASVRGFYLTYDRAYHYAGLRGFALPGDYTTRMLVMVNGHYLTDNVYSSNGFFAQDFGLEMDLVKRIEIVRGPSSALYGGNGIFATINLVTISPVQAKAFRASSETGSFGERKVMLSTSLHLGHGANLLVSTSVFENGGQSLQFREFGGPPNSMLAPDADAERGYHLFANLIWRQWSFTAMAGSREKQVPIGWFGTILGDPANKILDQRSFFEAAYSHDLSERAKLRWRIYYDRNRYRARYDYALESGIQDMRDLTAGDWVGSQMAYDFEIPHVGLLTVGGELNADIRALQRFYEVSPDRIEFLRADHPDLSAGLFAQQQWQISKALNVYLGMRFDDSRNHPHSISPRIALIYQASSRSTFKFLYGRAFRNPNAYETYYADGLDQIANVTLQPEVADTFEIAAEHRFNQRLSGLVTIYHYNLGNLIEAETSPAGLVQYQNSERTRANGVEIELAGKPARWLEAAASIALQNSIESNNSRHANSPGCVAKLYGAAPLFKDHLRAAVAGQYLSTRRTVIDGVVPSLWLADLTLTTHALHPAFDIQFGIRNLFDRTYYDPTGVAAPGDRIRGDGRAMFLKLILRTRN